MTNLIPAWVDGTLTPVDKLEAHVTGLRHMAVSVFVICEGQMLIQQRAACKYHTPNLWANTCCTHPDWNEEAADCAVRRLDEELGIVGLTPTWVEKLEYRADVGGDMIEHEVVDLFVINCEKRPEMALNPDEVQAVKWVSLAEIETDIEKNPARYTPWLKIYLKDHKASVFGPA